VLEDCSSRWRYQREHSGNMESRSDAVLGGLDDTRPSEEL
jgi:hypothetical protein